MSSYEDYISKILLKSKIVFEREKSFGDLKHGLFRFDFYLPRQNIIIEIDGQQHFSKVGFFYKNDSQFKKSLENDRRKNSYCLANNIKIYRVPYWEIGSITCFSDILQDKFLVKSRWHNDFLIWERKR